MKLKIGRVIKIQNIKKLMDFDSLVKEEEKNEEHSKAKISDRISTFRDVFFTPRIRRSPVHFDKIDRFLIWCEFGIIFPCGILLWTILYILGI